MYTSANYLEKLLNIKRRKHMAMDVTHLFCNERSFGSLTFRSLVFVGKMICLRHLLTFMYLLNEHLVLKVYVAWILQKCILVHAGSSKCSSLLEHPTQFGRVFGRVQAA